MRRIAYGGWNSGSDFDLGTHQGTSVRGDVLVIGSEAAGTRSYVDPHGDRTPVTYEQSTWLSPEVRPSFDITELIPSWNANTPQGTWIEIEVRASEDGIAMSRWYTLGRWAETDTDIHPASVPYQFDELASVAIDVLTSRETRTLSTYQLRVSLLRRPGSRETPTVRLAAMMASNIPVGHQAPRSVSGGAEGILIDVPAYSQQVHRGKYPQWDNGGESWCSPTSTMMVLAHWDAGPTMQDYAWVDPRHQDRFIAHAARHTFDHHFKGAGNWPFNTAYAAQYGMTAYVTRLRSLTEAEQFIKAGVPLVVSVSFTQDELEGAGYGTQGHLLTVIGFDANGNVICNDPASHGISSNDEVRTTYDRGQFEDAWMTTGGIVYVIHPPDVELPPRPVEANW